MKAKTTEVILFESDEAAQLKTVTGWVSRTGHFHGNNEQSARYDGCTHKTCECGAIMERHWLKCSTCREQQSEDRYMALKFKEWDGEVALYSNTHDKYFFSEDDLVCFIEEEEIDPADLQLQICEPNVYSEVDSSFWEDVLAEDRDIPDDMAEAVEKLNEIIRKQSPASWSPGSFRTSYELSPETK